MTDLKHAIISDSSSSEAKAIVRTIVAAQMYLAENETQAARISSNLGYGRPAGHGFFRGYRELHSTFVIFNKHMKS